jgi:hypothetical protein
MDVQYIKDINGNIAFAIVPIDIWEDITSQNPNWAFVNSQKETKKAFNPDEFFGCISIDMSEEQLFDELNQLRSEWDRDFR